MAFLEDACPPPLSASQAFHQLLRAGLYDGYKVMLQQHSLPMWSQPEHPGHMSANQNHAKVLQGNSGMHRLEIKADILMWESRVCFLLPEVLLLKSDGRVNMVEGLHWIMGLNSKMFKTCCLTGM